MEPHFASKYNDWLATGRNLAKLLVLNGGGLCNTSRLPICSSVTCSKISCLQLENDAMAETDRKLLPFVQFVQNVFAQNECLFPFVKIKCVYVHTQREREQVQGDWVID